VIAADPDALLALPGFDQETVDAVIAAAHAEQAARPPAAEPGLEAEAGAEAEAEVDGSMVAPSAEAADEAREQESN
jgi:hypothetical protein